MAEALDDAWAKLDRAGEHIKALEAEIRRFSESRPYSVTGDPDLKSGEYVLRIKPEEPPKRIGVLIGDVLSNLRPALDYLVGALSVLDSGKPHPSNQFPICDTKAAFKGELGKGRLAGLSPTHAALIEKLQPYPRRKGKVWLRALREYSNPDKHRHLNVLLTHIEGDFDLPTPDTTSEPVLRLTTVGKSDPVSIFGAHIGDSSILGKTDWISIGEPVTLGSPSLFSTQFPTLVPSVSFAPTSDRIGFASNLATEAKKTPAKRNVHVELRVSVGVAFPEGTPVIETMQVLESQIAKTLNAFEREF